MEFQGLAYDFGKPSLSAQGCQGPRKRLMFPAQGGRRAYALFAHNPPPCGQQGRARGLCGRAVEPPCTPFPSPTGSGKAASGACRPASSCTRGKRHWVVDDLKGRLATEQDHCQVQDAVGGKVPYVQGDKVLSLAICRSNPNFPPRPFARLTWAACFQRKWVLIPPGFPRGPRDIPLVG